MIANLRQIATVSMVASLAGCSTVESTALNPASKASTTGLVYYLPIRTIEADIKFVISACEPTADGKADLTYDIVPTVRTGLAADRGRAFTISKGLTGHVMKAMNFEIAQYENGTLKTVNAVADDRTAETATNVVSGALKIALGLTGLGFFDGESEALATRMADRQKACGLKTVTALDRIKALAEKLDPARDSAEAKAAATARVTAAEKSLIDARLVLKGAQETKSAGDVDLAERTLAIAVKELEDARRALKDLPASQPPSAIAQQIAAIVQRDLTFSASETFIPSERIIREEIVPIRYEVSRLALVGIKAAQPMTANLTLRMLYAGSGATIEALPAASAISATSKAEGVWTRVPASAILRVCVTPCSPATVRLTQSVSVPQWGLVSQLPLKSRAFAKNTTKLSFAPDGALVSLYSDTTSPAERASKAFADGGSAFSDFVTQRRTLLADMATAETAAEKAEIQKQIDLIDLQGKLAAAETGTTADQDRKISDLEFQIKEAQKQIELLEQQRKLEELRNGGGGSD